MPAFIDTLLATGRPETLAALRGLLDLTQDEGRAWHPSPEDWRDEVLYFLLPDRFSDNRESTRPLLTRAEIRRLRQASTSRPDIQWNQWADSGRRWQGGTINGIRGRLGYLQTLGVSAIWVGPIFKQRARVDSYHGYGIQDFLDVDPRFGTRADLVALVRDAHARGMRIILDVIVNHSGDNWGYVPPGTPPAAAINEPAYRHFPDFYGNPHNPAMSGWRLAWRNEHQQGVSFDGSSSAVNGPHDAVFPREFREPSWYARAGMGGLGNGDIGNAHAEHKRTDFFSLKDLALDAPGTLTALTDCFRYWIALTDCDGFRIDTVKHMALEETRNFCGAIREFASTLGKDNFLLVGEIAGGDDFQDFVLDNLAILQRNLSSALDIGSQRLILAGVAKGFQPASDYFLEFDAASQGFESHRAFGNRHVSILDDHDHVFGAKLRFSAEIPDDSPVKDTQVVAATALQLFTLGIPCIYYGTEQAFAGPAQHQLQFLLGQGWNDGGNFGDRYLREVMFGPTHPRAPHDRDLTTQVNTQDGSLPGFGAFGTVGQHCFDEASPAYVRIAALCRVRAAHPVLRDGRQYQRQMRLPHTGFGFQPGGELIAWSRILDVHEALIVTNPNGGAARGGDVVVAAELSNPGDEFVVLVNTAEVAADAAAGGSGSYHGTHPAGSRVVVRGRSHPGEPAFVEIRDVAPAEVIVLIQAG
jgi:glycosidase